MTTFSPFVSDMPHLLPEIGGSFEIDLENGQQVTIPQAKGPFVCNKCGKALTADEAYSVENGDCPHCLENEMLEVRCIDCGHVFGLADSEDECPRCHGTGSADKEEEYKLVTLEGGRSYLELQ